MGSAREQLNKKQTINKPESWVLWGVAAAILYVVVDMFFSIRGENGFPFSMMWGFILFTSLALVVTHAYGMPDSSQCHPARFSPRERKLIFFIFLLAIVIVDLSGEPQEVNYDAFTTIDFWYEVGFEFGCLFLISGVLAWQVVRGGIFSIDTQYCAIACLLPCVILAWILSYYGYVVKEEKDEISHLILLVFIAVTFSLLLVRLLFDIQKRKHKVR